MRVTALATPDHRGAFSPHGTLGLPQSGLLPPGLFPLLPPPSPSTCLISFSTSLLLPHPNGAPPPPHILRHPALPVTSLRRFRVWNPALSVLLCNAVMLSP